MVSISKVRLSKHPPAEPGDAYSADAMMTMDADLLWDIRKRLSFSAYMNGMDTTFLGLLKKGREQLRQSLGFVDYDLIPPHPEALRVGFGLLQNG